MSNDMFEVIEVLNLKLDRDSLRHAIVQVARDLNIPELKGLLEADELATAQLHKLMEEAKHV